MPTSAVGATCTSRPPKSFLVEASTPRPMVASSLVSPYTAADSTSSGSLISRVSSTSSASLALLTERTLKSKVALPSSTALSGKRTSVCPPRVTLTRLVAGLGAVRPPPTARVTSTGKVSAGLPGAPLFSLPPCPRSTFDETMTLASSASPTRRMRGRAGRAIKCAAEVVMVSSPEPKTSS